MGSYYLFGGWMFGLAWIGILLALRDPDEIWQSRTRRACLVLGVAVMLGATAVIVAASNASRESIWVYCLGCAVPVTLLAFGFSRSALVHPVLGAVGMLLAVLVLVGAGEAFGVHGQPLDGLAATAHHHHGLVIAALLVPLLVTSLACLPLRTTRPVEFKIVPDPKESLPNLRSGSVVIRRRHLIGAGVLLLFLIWLAGTNILGLLLGLGVVLAGSAVFLWRKDRADMRGVLGELKSSEKP